MPGGLRRARREWHTRSLDRRAPHEAARRKVVGRRPWDRGDRWSACPTRFRTARAARNRMGRWTMGFLQRLRGRKRRPRWRVPAAGFPCRSTLSAARPADGIPARCIEIPRPFGPRALLPARHSARSARTIQARFSAGQERVGDRRRPGSALLALLASLVAGRLGVTALLLFVLVFVGGREDLAAYARRRMRTIDADERTGLQNVVGALAADFPPLRHSRGARRTDTTAQAPRWRRGPRTGPPAARAGRARDARLRQCVATRQSSDDRCHEGAPAAG